MLLDAQGHILHGSVQAHALMQQTGLLRIQGHQLQALGAADNQWLQACMAQVLATSQAIAGSGPSIWSPADRELVGGQGRRLQHWSGQQLQVMVAPLPLDAQPYGMQCAAVVMLSDPSRVISSLTGALRSFYRLTLAEAKLVQGLINGQSPQEYAEATGVSINTVRSQFKAAASKVGVSRQADLVRVVLMGPALLRWHTLP